MSHIVVQELKKQLDREIRTKTILFELNDYVNLKDSMATVLKHFKEITACDAIGIRLYDGADYPYYAYEGLPEAFVMRESALCSLYPGIKTFKLPDNAEWATTCLCSDVINKEVDPSLPFFTDQGSFYTNDLPDIASSNKQCIFFGFKSLAIIRITNRDQCLGLIQLFSYTEIFTYDLVTYLEYIASYIGVAINNNIAYSRMKEKVDTLYQLVPMCAHCKKVGVTETGEGLDENDEYKWQKIEEYLKEQTNIEFTHTICPSCLEILYPEIFAKMQRH